MKHKHPKKQLLALFLVLSLVLQLAGGSMASAATPAESTTVTLTQTTAEAVSVTLTDETQEAETADAEAATQSEYADTDVVRVSIVLEEASTIAVGFDTIDIAQNTEAMAYRESLKETQAEMEAIISAQVLDGEELDVVWNLTLAANLISANVEYGQIEAIAALDGVEAVYIESVYEAVETGDDNDAEITTITSGAMTGTTLAWSEGYTGAGTRIAVIDTGTDTDHQSFDAGAFEYSLLINGAQAVAEGKFDTVDEYMESLNLLDTEEIASVLTGLNAYTRSGASISAEDLYLNSKLAFAYNYVDSSLDVTHDNDAQSEHGSHVAGIATANAYIPTATGYTTAIDSVYVTGQAPDAQLITMKVFGLNGGAYDSDYMAAIEDAIILGCDVVNLSLGSSTTGFTYSSTEYYNSIMDSLQNTNTVVVVAAGNSYSWSTYANNDASLLYTGDVSDSRIASPATYTNALAVASVDNTGFTGSTSTFEGEGGSYTGGVTEAGTAPDDYQVWTTLDTTGEGTEYEYVFLGDPSYLLDDEYEGDDAGDYKGYESDFEGLDLTGKIVLISRGTISFYVKHDNAALAGAAGVIIYNNVDGTITMDISSSGSTIPCVSITLAAAKAIFAASTVAEDGTRSGTVTVNAAVSILFGETDADISMSSFSSWGATESLTIKPEITAPGGSIYSVDGSSEDTTAYESMNGTSMASPQIAGISAVL